MVIIDFAAIAYLFPYHDTQKLYYLSWMDYPASLLDTTNSVFVTSQDE